MNSNQLKMKEFNKLQPSGQGDANDNIAKSSRVDVSTYGNRNKVLAI